VEAANSDLGAAVEGRRAVMVTLLAEVARNYLELRGAQKRVEVARENLSAQEEILEVTRSKRKGGVATDLDVARAAAQVSTTAATIWPLRAQMRRSMHALATLVAENPTALAGELEASRAIPTLPALSPRVPVGLPSELLLRRPDIRRAEEQVHAATANIGAATADLFPKFSLTGQAGLDSSTFSRLFDWQSRYFLLSPTVSWPVFDAGRIVSHISLEKARTQEAVLAYRKAVLLAVQEVEDSLVNVAAEEARHAALVEASKQSREAVEIARDQYQKGLTDFLNVLEAQRNLLAAEDAEVQANQDMAAEVVGLYKALGGGWEASEASGKSGRKDRVRE
jgi:outer membrane protein, multidrug efflux system